MSVASRKKIGTLRRFWKVTEINGERAAEFAAAETLIRGKAAPVAVMIPDVTELYLATEPDRLVSAHMVIGWDADRSWATDYRWDYLPVLGYAVKRLSSDDYLLHEERDGLLYPISASRAVEAGILNEAGKLIRRGQPSITECRSVRPFIETYAMADCVLSDGRTVEILTSIQSENVPNSIWYIGKQPAQTKNLLINKGKSL